MMKSMLFLSACALAACGAAQPRRPDDARLAKVRATFGVTITSDAQDAAYWALAREVADDRLVVGWSRDEIARQLGAGAPCGARASSSSACYALGALPAGHDGGTPVLIVDYDAAGACTAARAIHEQ